MSTKKQPANAPKPTGVWKSKHGNTYMTMSKKFYSPGQTTELPDEIEVRMHYVGEDPRLDGVRTFVYAK